MTLPVLAAFVIATLVTACDDEGGARDQSYGTDAAVGYTGPAPDASSGKTGDAAVMANNPEKANTAVPDGVNDLGVTADIHDAASSD